MSLQARVRPLIVEVYTVACAELHREQQSVSAAAEAIRILKKKQTENLRSAADRGKRQLRRLAGAAAEQTTALKVHLLTACGDVNTLLLWQTNDGTTDKTQVSACALMDSILL